MVWQMHRNVPSDDVLKAADDRVAAREAQIRRPAEDVFTISDEAYDQARRLQIQRNSWDLLNLMEVRRRNLFTFVMLVEYLEEKFKSSTDDTRLFERVAVVLSKSILRDYLLYSFIDSTSPGKDLSTSSYIRNVEKIDKFGESELSYFFSTRDTYNKSPSALLADRIKRELEEVDAALELLDLLPTIPHWPDEKLKNKISHDIYLVNSSFSRFKCPPDMKFSDFEKLDKEYFQKLFEYFESSSSKPYYMDSRQYEPAEKILNTQARVQAYYTMHCEDGFVDEPNRPSDKEGLLLEKKILSEIVNDKAIMWNLIENILSFHDSHSRLVEMTARIRNETYEPGSLDKEDEFRARYKASKDINLKEFPQDIFKVIRVATPILKYGGGGDLSNPEAFLYAPHVNYY